MAEKERAEQSENGDEGKAIYTTDQQHTAIEKARTEERSKLREEIEGLKEDKEILESEVEDLKGKLSKKPPVTADGGIDVTAAITEAVESARKEWEKTHKRDMKALEERVTSLSEESTSRRVQDITNQLVEDYEGKVIPALIRGETLEELEASAEASHKVWLDTMEQAGVEVANDADDDEEASTDDDEEGEVEDEEPLNGSHAKNFSRSAGVESARIKTKSQPVTAKKSQGRVASPLPKLPAVGDRGGVRRSDPDAQLKGVKSMTMKEYREQRPKILAAAKARYAV